MASSETLVLKNNKNDGSNNNNNNNNNNENEGFQFKLPPQCIIVIGHLFFLFLWIIILAALIHDQYVTNQGCKLGLWKWETTNGSSSGSYQSDDCSIHFPENTFNPYCDSIPIHCDTMHHLRGLAVSAFLFTFGCSIAFGVWRYSDKPWPVCMLVVCFNLAAILNIAVYGTIHSKFPGSSLASTHLFLTTMIFLLIPWVLAIVYGSHRLGVFLCWALSN